MAWQGPPTASPLNAAPLHSQFLSISIRPVQIPGCSLWFTAARSLLSSKPFGAKIQTSEPTFNIKLTWCPTLPFIYTLQTNNCPVHPPYSSPAPGVWVFLFVCFGGFFWLPPLSTRSLQIWIPPTLQGKCWTSCFPKGLFPSPPPS